MKKDPKVHREDMSQHQQTPVVKHQQTPVCRWSGSVCSRFLVQRQCGCCWPRQPAGHCRGGEASWRPFDGSVPWGSPSQRRISVASICLWNSFFTSLLWFVSWTSYLKPLFGKRQRFFYFLLPSHRGSFVCDSSLTKEMHDYLLLLFSFGSNFKFHFLPFMVVCYTCT